jgi:hypothetical protein
MYSKLWCIALIGLTSISVQAQIDCNSGRFDVNVFNQIDVNANIVYGNNTTNMNQNIDLKLDIYSPQNDTMQKRPLIIWAHGGSFIDGNKNLPDVTRLSTDFAKKGYVCASIQYRLGITIDPFNIAANTLAASLRASQDMRAAVRYFKKDAATNNLYKIDTNLIYVGGVSAGGFAALQVAYLDKDSEVPLILNPADLGGLIGNSGNPNYSSSVRGVINLSGAVADVNWLESGNAPLVSLHGNQDEVVPYGNGMVRISGFNIISVQGSKPIHEKANELNIPDAFYTFYNQLHVPFSVHSQGLENVYMDTTIQFVSNFLYSNLGCVPSNPNPFPNTPIDPTVNVDDYLNEIEVQVYPNPSKSNFFIQLNQQYNNASLRLFNFSGKKLLDQGLSNKLNSIGLTDIPSGIYFYEITIDSSRKTGKIQIL